MAIIVKLKNAAGDILYPQTEWNSIQNKPSLHITEFMNISGYTLEDNEDFCLYWIGQHDSIGYDIDKIKFNQIFSLCIRNLKAPAQYFQQLRINRIDHPLPGGTLNIYFVNDNDHTSTSEKMISLTSDNILQDNIFDIA